ncbi:MAG: hypothetical protein J7497_12230, partial [Chitinophagaceae bacterium]|nr:hypothetical protein [Chitinophagaceae bacterium]
VTAPTTPTHGQKITLYMLTFSGGSVTYPTYAGTGTLTADQDYVTLQWSDDVAGYIVISKKEVAAGGLEMASTITSSTTLTQASPGFTEKYQPVDATSGNITLTFPASPSNGKAFTIEKIDATANTVTLGSYVLSTAGTGWRFVYRAATSQWRFIGGF